MLLDNYLGGRLQKRQQIYLIIIVGFILLLSNGLNYYNWNPTYAGWITKIIYLYFLWFFIRHSTRNPNCHFRTEILLLTFLQFPSMINSWLYFGQSFIQSLTVDLAAFSYITYFMLHHYRVEERTILKVILFMALLIVGIQLFQQFSYPNCWFGIRSEEGQALTNELAEQRNGLWRFRMHINGFYTCPILFAAWIWLQRKFDSHTMIVCCLLLVSVYLTLTRQVMVACIFAVFMSSFIGERKSKKGALLLGLLFIVGLYEYYDVLFSSLSEQTKEDSTEDNIRLVASSYFWEESLKSPLTFLFGYGNQHADSSYGDLISRMKQDYGLYTSDVGFIGQIYEKGLLYVLVTYWIFYKLYFRLKTKTPLYIKMMVLFCTPMTPMIFPTIDALSSFVWVMMIYIVDLHVNKSPLALESTRNLRNT